MDVRDWVSRRVVRSAPPRAAATATAGPTAAAAEAAASPATASREGVFVSRDSVLTFGGATAAVTLIWKVVGVLDPALAKGQPGRWTAFAAACAVGLLLYLIHARDPENQEKTPRDLVIAIFIAALNTLVLFSASVGLESVTSHTDPKQDSVHAATP